jgi:hypothetical protein
LVRKNKTIRLLVYKAGILLFSGRGWALFHNHSKNAQRIDSENQEFASEVDLKKSLKVVEDLEKRRFKL